MSGHYYRVQAPGRNPHDLISDPMTYAWNSQETPQHGVSVCDSVEELATYLATKGQGIELWTDWVLVELSGEYIGTGHDGEPLIIPDAVVAVSTLTDDFFARYEAAYDAAQEGSND